MNRTVLTRENYKLYYGQRKQRVYAPQLSEQVSLVVRYVATAAGKPMTSCLNQMVALALANLDKTVICASCKSTQLCYKCPLKVGLPGYSNLEKLLKK